MEFEEELEQAENISAKKDNLLKSKRKSVQSVDHSVRRRAPFRFPKKKRDIYVNNKTSFQAYLKKCEKLLDSNVNEVIIHGLGGAISKACNLALRIKEIHCNTLDLDIKTSSVSLIDDLEPKNDEADYDVNERVNSAIHIRVFRTALIGPLRFQK
ncbi:hypothetical protein QAD02_019801 [Eretmocerus hayati]|uniref:Uncharacterized protein n=1 Tax=Eretmocerus hayati TaxID=131215 RepID=A0ACC2PK92_9HYME|nr:hypothetical protein QAD02_019801 [Eretmocerus hayati]